MPAEFLNRWITVDDNGKRTFKYIDFASDQVVEVEVENDPLIKVLFEWDTSFDIELIQRQYSQIAKIARTILIAELEKKGLKLQWQVKRSYSLSIFIFSIFVEWRLSIQF
ncbi:hypothetical protein SCLARK_00961 [Spiroplasma clarkii]|uniref:hypothetical protein n=1 Tax=Spiroplasma clarkii TaxID=2139 RepID=UPI000B551786|nr:hypothetical protein [Spiroplasma clarkii]ARU91566.1 hypothetical protein SCLARK_00961 [Spiroplasma clarkii]